MSTNGSSSHDVNVDDEPFDTKGFFIGPSTMDHITTKTDSSRSPSQGQSIAPVNQSEADKMTDYIAIGTVRLISGYANDHEFFMKGLTKEEPYPNRSLIQGEKYQWLKTELHRISDERAIARLYVLPEDINRSVRGSLKDFRKVLRSLVDFIDTSPSAWNGDFSHDTPLKTYSTPSDDQEESLFYIFNTLESPKPSIEKLSASIYPEQAMSDILEDNIDGLKTKLYSYQKRSVAMMLQKEACPAKTFDSRKPQFTDLRGKPFYFDVLEGILLSQPVLYSEPQGGILAETMGYGKTLICLALILATRGHYPKIPEGRLDTNSKELNHRTPSLLELAAKALKHSGTPWKAQLSNLEQRGYYFERMRDAIDKYDATFAEPIFHPTTPSRRASTRESFNVLRLCYSTLVIVPPNLLVQWQQEIGKHTHDYALDVLVLDSSTKVIPHYQTLMKYDIVLITKARFEQEYRDDDLNQGRRARGEGKFRSPLTEVRWLRVICDEGHGFAGANYRTNAMAMLDKMSIERRWVVSGTPSNSLHGVEVNLATNETTNDDRTCRDESIQMALERRKTKDSGNEEVKDMERLRVMVVKFLKLQPWANQKGHDYADWRAYLAPFDAQGNRRFAPALRKILQSLIIRHRIEDIDADLSLPPLYNTTVYLQPSYYDKLSMNLFRMVLTSNAVTSERADEDYMFHPNNRKSLDELITNLRHSSFHWVGFTQHEVSQALHVSNTYLDNHLDSISDTDGALITAAILNAERALADSGWKAFSSLHEIGVYVEDFPQHAAEAWALHGEVSKPLLLGTVQAREAQQHVFKHSQSDDPAAGLIGAGLRAMHSAKARASIEQKARDKRTNGSNGKSQPLGSGEPPKIKHQSESSIPLSSPTHVNPDTSLTTPIPISPVRKRPLFLAISPLPLGLRKTKVIGFTSAKLNYLCSRILKFHKTEKIIIFYDSNNIAFWIAEALELLSVKFLIYANTLSVSKRAAYLATFNHSDVFRVLLMDLKQASHGLHVACASRVFIVSPIWQPNVEAQAIKRAHRIGQTKPVYVETLVLKGTLEEKILHRRRQMSNVELLKAEKSLLDDGTMNAIIREEGFLKITDEEKLGMEGSTLETPIPLFEKTGDEDVGGLIDDDDDLILGIEDKHIPKRKKSTKKVSLQKGSVAFATPTGTLDNEAASLATPIQDLDISGNQIRQQETPSSSSSSSIFGGGERPRKTVRIAFEFPTGSDEP